MLWRRLDMPGCEVARLSPAPRGWVLEGTAILRHERRACSLAYRIDCDSRFRTRAAVVSGWIGGRSVSVRIAADARHVWRLDGARVPSVTGCLDLDLAFSPATNLLPIRRLKPRRGEPVAVRAAWLRFPEMALAPLDQRYTAVERGLYRYESGNGAFVRMLRVNRVGFVVSYPGFWEADDAGPAA